MRCQVEAALGLQVRCPKETRRKLTALAELVWTSHSVTSAALL